MQRLAQVALAIALLLWCACALGSALGCANASLAARGAITTADGVVLAETQNAAGGAGVPRGFCSQCSRCCVCAVRPAFAA